MDSDESVRYYTDCGGGLCSTLGGYCDACAEVSSSDVDLHEAVLAELLACYGEGENTDWPYLNDLVDVVVGLIHKYSDIERPTDAR